LNSRAADAMVENDQVGTRSLSSPAWQLTPGVRLPPTSSAKVLAETGFVVLALVKPLLPSEDLSGQLICGPIEA
jgi:hypothetical protein